ncbi:MAG: hypothetical protein H6898_17225 [Rhodobacter sp.]|nr:hypothetical protein [Paracoccaceae bacterium]MCC0078300.1 hypothetical protein [Rhodobacter sp.]
MHRGWTLVTVLVLIGLIPMLAGAMGTALSDLGGCHPHMPSPGTCRVGGVDLSRLVPALDLAGRLFFLTAPIALAGIVLGITLAVLSLLRRARS